MSRRTACIAIIALSLVTGAAALQTAPRQIVFRNSADPDNVGLPTVTWTEQSLPVDTPSLMYFTNLLYDSVSGRILAPLNPHDASNIYASAMHSYTTSGNDWTYLGGSTSAGNNCAASGSPSPWPGNRHPVAHFAIDTFRHRLWYADGVCANNERNDFWFYALNSDPTTNTWTKVSDEGTVDLPVYGLMVYATAYDVLVSFGMTAGGSGELWVYCPAAILSGDQTSAGCSAAQTWTRLLGPAVEPTLPDYNRAWLNSMFWDSTLNKVVIFTKQETGGARAIWFYDVLTKSISKRTGTQNTPSDSASLSTGAKDHVLITSGSYAGQYLFHRTTRDLSCVGSTTDFLYNSSTEKYTQIPSSGGGPTCAAHLAWDATAGKIVAWSRSASNAASVWTAVVQ
jgi:hypothetical protein